LDLVDNNVLINGYFSCQVAEQAADNIGSLFNEDI
jgi:hypothetical protein